MDQIAVAAEYFHVLPSGGLMPEFTGIFFVDSNGKVSLNHEVLSFNSLDLSYWNRMGKSKRGVQGLDMWFGLGEDFLIIDDDALDVAIPFFEKYLSSKFKP